MSVEDDRVESEDGSQVQEMDVRMHTSTSAQPVEVAEEINVVTELSVNMGGDTNLEGQSVTSGEKFSVKLDVSEHILVSSSDQFF